MASALTPLSPRSSAREVRAAIDMQAPIPTSTAPNRGEDEEATDTAHGMGNCMHEENTK